MANTKRIKTELYQKHGLESEWQQAVNFIPQKGQIIVYDLDENYPFERFKIGDGETNVNQLPFTGVGQTIVSATLNTSTNKYSTTYGGEIFNNYYANYAEGLHSHAEGNETLASADFTHAEGDFTRAVFKNSHAEGHATTAAGEYSHIEGYSGRPIYDEHPDWNGHDKLRNIDIYNEWATASIKFALAKGNPSHVEGANCLTLGNDSHAEGYQTVAGGGFYYGAGGDLIGGNDAGSYGGAYGQAAHSEGYKTRAFGSYSHSEGNGTQAIGPQSHAEGQTTIASGGSSHSEGKDTEAIGFCSHAEGISTDAQGDHSHAEGNASKAIGAVSHAEGNGTQALGYASHSEGVETSARGAKSHVGGSSSSTSTYADSSFIHGHACKVNAHYSAAFGYHTQTYDYGYGIGNVTPSTYVPQFVIGKYNAPVDNALFIVGNGKASGYEANAFEVNIDGTAKLSGKEVLTEDYIQFGTYDTPAEAIRNGQITSKCKIYIQIQE